MQQLELFPNLVHQPPYDHYIVFFSGGKDSIASTLKLINEGIPKDKIELWHHLVDGQEGSTFMDWPVTPAYCRAFSEAMDIPLYYSWRKGGFEAEMLKQESPTGEVCFETPNGLGVSGGGGKLLTRMKFPQVGAITAGRWCSPKLKIDVARVAYANQPRFWGKKVLFISGERAEESPTRQKYKGFEPEKRTRRLYADRWRPIHAWPEQDVWAILESFSINTSPLLQGRLQPL